MPIPLDSFFLHSGWATRRLIEACEELSDDQLDATVPGVYGSIRQTLVHLLSAEQYYLLRLGRDLPEDRVTDSYPGFEALKRAATDTGDALAEAARVLSPSDSVEGGPGDEFVQAAASVFLIQALTHSHEHRTQIMTLLSTLGAGPPGFDAQIDGWSWGGESGTLHSKPG